MKKIINFLAYLFMLGPPRALRLHAEAQEKGGELHGMPVWMVFTVEFLVRTGIFLVLSWGLQEALGNELFRRFKVYFLVFAVFGAGILHTTVYFFCFEVMWGVWSKVSLGRVYRIGRNLGYSVIPPFPAAGVVLAWQEYNHIPLFQGEWVQSTFFATWAAMLVLGMIEALMAKRKPLGIVLGRSGRG